MCVYVRMYPCRKSLKSLKKRGLLGAVCALPGKGLGKVKEKEKEGGKVWVVVCVLEGGE